LGLARRLVDPADPLFARVAVNRIWYHLFGRGIVGTVDNLGAQGEVPTHPELLDWLADDFVTSGWSQKRLIKQLMLSRTYQMSSRPDDLAAEQQDPANSLFHRASVWRLEAEPIRDTLLQVSGRLDGAMFGPSMPAYLNPFIRSKFQPKTSGPLDGGGRRSVYLEVRRNFLHPMLVDFDMPTPFTSVGRRNISNVPAQALAMLNDPFIQALAHHWAERMLKEFPEDSSQERIERMYEVALCRLPTAAETRAAEDFLGDQSELIAPSTSDHDRNISVWTDLAQVLFNEKEFVLRN
jgi:hypothetical protein